MVLQEGVVDTRPLRHGDQVVLSELGSHSALRSSSGLGTYLYADELAEDVPGRGVLSIPGIHECVFRLLPHQEYRARDEFLKALAASSLSPDDWRAQLGTASALYSSLSVLAHEAEIEAQTNARKTSSSRGRVVVYGERIQLQHVWSGGTVTAFRECSEQDPQGILIQLVQHVDEGAWFTVLSPRKILQHGERVRNNAEIVLENVRYPGRFLTLNTATASLDASIAIEAALLPHAYISRRLECFLGFNRQSFAARIFRRGDYDADEDLAALTISAGAAKVARAEADHEVVGTEIVQIYHKEGGAVLVVETPSHGTDINEHEKPPERGLAFFMPLHGKQQDPGARSLFLVQHVQIEHGGEEVGPRDTILLQHVVTGLYLCWEADSGQLSATSDYAGRVRANGGRVDPPPTLAGSHDDGGYDPDAEAPRSPHGSPHSPSASARESPRLGGGLRRAGGGYAGAANPCEMAFVHVNTTSGAVLPTSAGGNFSFVSSVYLTHRDGDDARRLFLQKSAEITKVGVKEMCCAEATRAPSLATCLLEIRASDMSMARSVLDITSAVAVVNGLVANIARAEQLEVPRDRNGDVDMGVRDQYVADHPTTTLTLNSVPLLDQLVGSLLAWCTSEDDVAADPDGEGEGQIGGEEVGRADFRGGVGGARGAGSAGTAGGAGWGDARRNAGAGKRMQHLLRQHGAVLSVCKLVQTVFADKKLPLDMVDSCLLGEGLLELARKSYRFMTAVMRNNNANRRVCVQFVRTFQQHLQVDFLAVECLFELLRGPVEVLNMLREDFFTHGVRLLKGSRSPAMLMLLSASCIAGDGTPVRENQGRVLKFLFEQAPELVPRVRHSLPTLESDPFSANIHMSDRLPGGPQGEVAALDLRDVTDDLLHDYRAAADEHVALFQYYLAAMELMCATVHGRNWPASLHLLEHSFDLACGYNDLLFLIKHEMCPWILRALATNLMTALYVDRLPFVEVSTFTSVRTWTKLHESVADEKLKEPTPYSVVPANVRPPQGLRELKEQCLAHLDKCSNIDVDATGQTIFAQRLADCCLRMARLGAYHHYDDHFRLKSPLFDDIRPLCGLLIGMLDGRTDQISLPPDVLHARRARAEDTNDVVELEKVRLSMHPSSAILRDLKVTICDILEFFWACRTDERVSRFFEKYEQLVDDDVGPALFASVTRGTEKRKAKNEFTSVVPGEGEGGDDDEKQEDELALPLSYANDVEKWNQSRRPLWTRETVTQLISTLFRNDTYGREVIEAKALKESEGSLSVVSRVLLDLSLYQDPRLSRRAFKLLICQLGQRHEFVQKIAGVHFIVRPRSARAFFKLRADVHEFHLALPWVYREDVLKRAEAMHTCERLLKKWTQNLQGHGAGGVRDGKEEADTDEGEYRRMLFQLHVHASVMEVLLMPMRRVFTKKEGTLDTAVDKERQELFDKCHQFVAAAVEQHRTLQEYFFQHRAVLQSHVGIVGIPAAETLAAIVKDHDSLVNAAGEEYIRTLFGGLRHYRTKRAAWINAIRAMVTVKGIPVKRHQNVALEYLALHSKEFCSLMMDPAEWNMRIDMVFEGEFNAPHLTTSRVDYHVACVHLLADCAMGNNPAAEVQVAALISWDDIMDVLLDLNVRGRGASGIVEPMPLAAMRAIKSAFIRLLYHTYIKTKMQQPRDQVRRPDNRFWLATRVEPPRTATTSVLGSAPPGSDLSTRKPQRRLHAPGFLAYMVQEIKDLGKLLGDVANGKVIKAQHDMAALKHMVLVDLVPMLTEYYTVFYDVGCSGSDKDTEVSEALFDVLESLVTAGNLPLQHVTPVQTLVVAIGDKVESRGNRRKLLEFTLTTVRPADAQAGEAGAGGSQLTSPSGKMDAPSLLRDLMTTSARALKLQLAQLSGVEIADGEPMAGGLGALARLCCLNAEVPLHHERKFGDESFGVKQNPRFSDVATRLAAWVSSQKAGCGEPDSSLLADAGVVLAALVYLQDPRAEAPRDKVSLRTSWERLRRAQDPSPLNVPQTEGLQVVQRRSVECGFLEAAAVLVAQDDKTLHRGGLLCLNALLARGCPEVQDRLVLWLRAPESAGAMQEGAALGGRGKLVMRHLADVMESAGAMLKQYKRLRKFQIAFPSTLSALDGSDAEVAAAAASVTNSADFGWGSAGLGRLALPEAGSVTYQEWAAAGKGGGGGGGGPSGHPTPAFKRALVDVAESLGAGSTLSLVLRTIDNMCRGGYRPLQLVLAAPLPPRAPLPDDIKVQETEMSEQARKNLQAAVPVRTLLEAVTQVLRQAVPCLALAVRYQDNTILDFCCRVVGCLATIVDGPCSHNQMLLIEAGIPALLMEVISISYRPLDSSETGFKGTGQAAAASQAAPNINISLAALKGAAGNLLHLLSVGSSSRCTQRVAPDELGHVSSGGGGGAGAAAAAVPVLDLLRSQIDCALLVKQAEVNSTFLSLGRSEVARGAARPARIAPASGAATVAAGAGGGGNGVELEIEDIGLDSRRGRELLQDELANYLVVLRCLEREADILGRVASEAAATRGLPGVWAWEGPSSALRQMQRQAPRLWAFASARVRCVELVAEEEDASPAAARQLGGVPGAVAPGEVRQEMGAGRGKLVLWFALSDHLFEWNAGGGTARAAELTWDALHERGGRGAALTHGAALLRCWGEDCRRFLAWRALRGCRGFVGGVAPGAPPEDALGSHEPAGTHRAEPAGGGGGGGGKGEGRRGATSPVRTVRSPTSMASGASSRSGSQSRRKGGKGVVGVGAVAGKAVAEQLRLAEGVPCAISLVVALVFTTAYGVPSEAGSGGGGGAAGNGALYEGRYNVTAEMLAWGRAGATLGSGRWELPGELAAYDPWRFAPWAQALLRALSALHVVAMACEMASWLLNEWPVLFLRVAADERSARLSLQQPARRRIKTGGGRRSAGAPPPMDVAVMDWRLLGRLLAASVTPYYLVVLSIFSLLGAVHSPLFLLAHLVRLLAPLAPAARLAAPQLLRTGGIALATLVCYGLFAYTYFSNEVTAVSRACHSPWQCVSTVVLAALARDNDIMAHDAQDFAETPPFFAASSWGQFHSLYAASFLIVWGFLLQGALIAHILDAFAQLRQLNELRERDCEDTDLFTRQRRCRPRGAAAAEAAMQGRQLVVGKEGAGSLGALTFESDAHSPANWVLFLCWASEQVRGTRWVVVERVVAQFVEGNPRFLPLASEAPDMQ